MAEVTQLVPPHSIDAETGVLGAVLLGDQVLPKLLVDVGLRPDHFYRERHRLIFESMIRLTDRGERIDALTVSEDLDREAKADEAGGTAYVHSLPNLVPAVGNAPHYAERVVELARLRLKIDAFRRGQEGAYQQDWDAVRDAEAALAIEVRERRQTVDERKHRLLQVVEGDQHGICPWPFAELNDMAIGGIGREHLTILGGWHAHGKSVLLDQILEHATNHKAKAGLYINEMSVEERDLRFVARRAAVPLKKLLLTKGPDFDPLSRERIENAIDELPFEVIPASGLSAREIVHDIRRSGFDVVGIDLLNGLPGSSETKDIDENVRVLAAGCRETGCHIIACQHLNHFRDTSSYPPEPVVRDLRGSGQLGDLANNVMFVYRQEERSLGEPTGNPGDDAIVKFTKIRGGIPGVMEARFDGSRMRFLPKADDDGRRVA